MSLVSRLAVVVAVAGAALGAAPGVLASAPPVDGSQTEVAATLKAADAAGLSSATRGTMAQLAPLPEAPTTVAGDSLIVPPDSGTGRRVVYSKGIMRVWLIDENNLIYNTHRVSGRMDQPPYGTFQVFSRSTNTCALIHPDICMRFMVRFTKTRAGNNNIGFHEIPRRNGVPLQSDDQLGQALSGGCVRQVTDDAIIMWDWAQLGTVVVVVP